MQRFVIMVCLWTSLFIDIAQEISILSWQDIAQSLTRYFCIFASGLSFHQSPTQRPTTIVLSNLRDVNQNRILN